MGAADKGVKKSFGDQSGAEITHDQGTVDEEEHGWAPDAPGTGEAKERAIAGHQKAFEALDQAETSVGEAPTEDPSVPPEGVGESQTRRGEDVMQQEGQEPGRTDLGTKGESERPYGTVEPGKGPGVKPSEPIDEDMPSAQTGDQGG